MTTEEVNLDTIYEIVNLYTQAYKYQWAQANAAFKDLGILVVTPRHEVHFSDEVNCRTQIRVREHRLDIEWVESVEGEDSCPPYVRVRKV